MYDIWHEKAEYLNLHFGRYWWNKKERSYNITTIPFGLMFAPEMYVNHNSGSKLRTFV